MLSSILLSVFCLGIPLKAEVTEADLKVIRERYRSWVLDTPTTDYADPHIQARYGVLQRRVRRVLQKWQQDYSFQTEAPLYDTRRAGVDQKEVAFLVTEALPHLAIAYSLKGPDRTPSGHYRNPALREQIFTAFDRLHQRGFRAGMLMPWKAKEVADQPSPPPQAIVVDFHLRTSGYALAAFLMREELAQTGRLQRTLATCRDIMGHDEKFGSLYAPKLNADGIRIAVNFALPALLAAGDLDHLAALKGQVDRSMAKESDASDTIKPDGLGFHHRGVYMVGYSAYGVAQAAFATP